MRMPDLVFLFKENEEQIKQEVGEIMKDAEALKVTAETAIPLEDFTGAK